MTGPLSPRLHEGLVRLGALVPSFAQAAWLVAFFTGVTVSEATARRRTEAAGAAAVALHDAEVTRLEREKPSPPVGPRVQQLSADGAMVPLVGGVWAEAKTLALGEVTATRGSDGTPVVRTTDVSYLSRLSDAATFSRSALGETHRRGTETAGTVVAVTDGSEWLQGLVDLHRPDAVRVLDYPHAVEHLNAAAQACFGEGAPEAVAWLDQQATELRDGDPDRVLDALRALPTALASDLAAAEAARTATLGYLGKRREQIAYARFQALGLPIGSGMVESANKLVVEGRLKGPGMHWARSHVDPMLALRCAVANDRWDELWPQIAHHLRDPRICPSQPRRARGLSAAQAARPRPEPRRATPASLPALLRPHPDQPKQVIDGRPSPDHPRRTLIRAAVQHHLDRKLVQTKR